MSDPQPKSPELDLSLCAQEPIHIPGAVQSHGALLAVLTDVGLVTHASANLAAILGRPAQQVLGRPLQETIGSTACGVLQKAWQDGASGPGEVHSSMTKPGGSTLHLRAYRSGRHTCVDIEPTRPEMKHVPDLAVAHAVLGTFKSAATSEMLCALAASGLKAITGYDRVMVYRFDQDGHGEVIAEACEPQLVPYLGLHYPASDIPPQARRLFVQQTVCGIADCNYQPVPLLVDPAQDDGTPLDLTHSALRSVSPIHRQYMRNMNMVASLTIGLVQGQDLWGMLVCHHGSVRVATPELRAIADISGQIMSLLLGSLLKAEALAVAYAANVALQALVERFAAPQPLHDVLASTQTELLRLVRATGAVLSLSGTLSCLGRAPEPAAASRALMTLQTAATGDVLAIDDLGLRYPALVDCIHDGSGALLLRLGGDFDDAILWLRPEQARTVTWGGDPTSHATADPVTGPLSPRASFAGWKQIVTGRSAPWTAIDLTLAHGLGQAIRTEMLRRADTELAKRTKAELSRFDSLFEASPTALLLVGSSGRIEMVNRHLEYLFGYHRTELLGEPVERLLPTGLREQHVELRRSFLSAPSARAMGNGLDLHGLRKDGTEFPLEVELSPMTIDGNIVVLAGISDITARRDIEREKLQQQHELEQSNADLEEFAYVVSHDLKSPLRAIGHLAQWIDEDLVGKMNPDTSEHLGLLKGRVLRMDKLLDGLLQYSRIGHAKTATEGVNLAEVVDNVAAMLSLPPGFIVCYEGDGTQIRTQRVALQVVLENLISNAVKHHDRTEARIVITARLVDGVAEVRVSDDGPGIAKKFHQRIFQIFQTLTSRDDLEASGIGLAIVKRKVERHGGRIWVESAPPTRGTSFVFTWMENPPRPAQ